ncbi:MAG: DNA-3-methyladenine glycosylase [Bacteroidota bacterium]|nr:DNA-3-methyladenine glycosylase [Bacteroidota bacterium]
MLIIPHSFYLRDDVVRIAKDLLGKYLVTRIDGDITSGMITETEAYAGAVDKASHAYGNRCTARTEVMFREGGIAYVYLCYGIHSLFNIVTNLEGIPHAILIRGIIPDDGIDIMLKRTKKKAFTRKSGIGPGNVGRLLGIHYSMSGIKLISNPEDSSPAIWVEDRGVRIPSSKIQTTTRIGVGYAEEDALLPYRFILTE